MSEGGFLLDTDIVSLIFHHPHQQPNLARKVLSTPPDLIYVSVITCEELIQGAFALIRREQKAGRFVAGYRLLHSILVQLPRFQLLPFDSRASDLFNQMPAAVRRLGRADCMIAASALQHGCTVITRNIAHFQRIPGVLTQDWTNPR